VNALMMRADPGSSPGQALSPQAGSGEKAGCIQGAVAAHSKPRRGAIDL
jgi:hypothetical protein